MTEIHDEATSDDGFKPAPIPDNEPERLRELRMLDRFSTNRSHPNVAVSDNVG